MALVSQRIKNLLGGASELPAHLRDSAFVDRVKNVLLDSARGVLRRPPLEFVKKLSSDPAAYDESSFQTLRISGSESYHLVVGNGSARAFDALTGAELPLEVDPEAVPYLYDGGQGFRATAVGNTAFLVNRGMLVKNLELDRVSPWRPQEVLIWVQRADYNTTYSLTILGQTISITTAKGESPDSRLSINTDAVAQALLDKILADPVLSEEFSDMERVGSSVYLTYWGDDPVTIAGSDGLADKGVMVINGKVQVFEDLPPVAPEGFVAMVSGDPGMESDDWWVQYKDGMWRETVKPNTLIALDPSTMPHAISRPKPVWEGVVRALAAPRQTMAWAETGLGWEYDHNAAPLDPYSPYRMSVKKTGFTISGNTVRGNFRQPAMAKNGLSFRVKKLDLTDCIADVKLSAFVRGNQGSDTLVGSVVCKAGQKHENVAIPVNMTAVHTALTATGTRLGGVDLYRVTADPQAPTPLPPGWSEAWSALSGEVCGVEFEGANAEQPPVKSLQDPVPVIDFGLYTEYPAGSTHTITAGGKSLVVSLGYQSYGSGLAVSFVSAYGSTPGFPYYPVRVGSAIGFWQSIGGGSAMEPAAVPPLYTSTMAPGSNTAYLGRDGLRFYPFTQNFVGMTLRNDTTGASGPITAHTTSSVTATMSGGERTTFKPGDRIRIDPDTGFLKLAPVVWDERAVGDLKSNPWPGFVGKFISDVFFYSGRLGVLAGENVVLSEADNLTNFFRKSVTVLSSSDLIDVASGLQEIARFDSALNWNGTLYLFAPGRQFTLSGSPALSPQTVRLDLESSFASDPHVPPLAAGSRLFLTRERGGTTQVSEFSNPPDYRATADEATANVPSLLSGSPVAITGDEGLGVFLVLTSKRDRLYVYLYGDGPDGRRTMGAWGEWEFAGNPTILHCAMVDGILTVITKRSDGVYLERLDVSYREKAARFLDSLVVNPVRIYDAPSNKTTFTLPYAVPVGCPVVAIRDGVSVALTRVTATSYTAPGNLAGGSCVVGLDYDSYVDMGVLHLRDQEGRAITDARLVLKDATIYTAPNTHLVATVTRTIPQDVTSTFSVENPAAFRGEGRHRVGLGFPNHACNIRLTSAGSLGRPMVVQSVEWRGMFYPRNEKQM